MKIKRLVLQEILEHFKTSNKGVIIYGPRQVGKTTLVKDLLALTKWKTLVLNGDSRGEWWNDLQSRRIVKYKSMLHGYEALFVDEAQRIPEIGLILKIIRDEFPEIKVIATGSSSLDLSSRVSEPLTGRVYTYKLYPISQLELSESLTWSELNENIEERLIFGSYPEIFSLNGAEEKKSYLNNIVDNYLYKDLLEYDGINNSNKIRDLIMLLAFQLGSQVSILELSEKLQLSRSTVDKYIDLLEKSYIVFRLGGFSRNLRKEVTKMDKIYFYDVGVRNTIIGNLNYLSDRNDSGALWENYMILERMKMLTYIRRYFSHYFWRLTSGSEIDLIEEEDGKLTGYEFKYGTKVSKMPAPWGKAYPEAKFEGINRDNFWNFVGVNQ